MDQRPNPLPETLDKLMREMVSPEPAGKGGAKKVARRDGVEGGPGRAGAADDGSEADDDEDGSEDEDDDIEMLCSGDDDSSVVSEQVGGRSLPGGK